MNTLQPYEFLGLTPKETTMKELKAAYYRLALVCHPDKGGDPEAMKTLHLAYRWIYNHLETTESQSKSFAEYYGDTVETTPLPNFTDIMADTLGYTRDLFETWCLEAAGAHDDPHLRREAVRQMLFVPGFEYALQHQATTETLETHIRAFLSQFVADQRKQTLLGFTDGDIQENARLWPEDTYVAMTDNRGYGDTIQEMAADDKAYSKNIDRFTQSIETSMVLYKEPHCFNTLATQSLLNPQEAPAVFTHLATSLPQYDYQEAFTQLLRPEMNAWDFLTPDAISKVVTQLETELAQKEIERRLQDTQFYSPSSAS